MIELKNKITNNDKCLGLWCGVKCHLSPRWFVKTVDGFYRCPECKTVYRDIGKGIYKVLEETL